MSTIDTVIDMLTSLLTWFFTEAMPLFITFITSNPLVLLPLFLGWIIAMVIGFGLSLFRP